MANVTRKKKKKSSFSQDSIMVLLIFMKLLERVSTGRNTQQIHRQLHAPGWDSSDHLQPSLAICHTNSTSSAQNLKIYHSTNAIIHLMISPISAATKLIVL